MMTVISIMVGVSSNCLGDSVSVVPLVRVRRVSTARLPPEERIRRPSGVPKLLAGHIHASCTSAAWRG